MNDALPAPLDVRVMNMIATILFVCCAVGLLVGGGWWFLRNPAFSIGRIVVHGDLSHINPVSLRANVAPQLMGNFYTLNLQQAREVFEGVPWIRKAQVRREFPNGLAVEIQEHQARAFWGAEGSPTLVNNYGEVFEADADDDEDSRLPRLIGPDGRSLEMLQMYDRLAPAVKPLGSAIDTLALNGRGSWRMTLEGGASIEMGSGSTIDVLQRLDRFVRTVSKVAAQQGRKVDSLETADLRQMDGYALRLRGVTTVSAETAAARARTAAARATARPAAARTTTTTRTPGRNN
ncbi:FtsQ-type POTRA domain-containing protein [Diaphorobacter ruginosibacter]|uniref:Cell division protein FtsQ n=1 Tax=Diaphorobacter ruginosibacter TaxID=1715720 RepID=A0A7G9RM85_9BURK|nr:cell division protein FtsQ/DivIB [Diaphorobacter ruginosibacter]QNN56710.1 FtsQ-type POTRA domain-containing protein [Diaphorobacter ruginosibacter]